MRPLDKAMLRRLAEEQLRILDESPESGQSPGFLSGDLGERLLELGVEMDGGEAFCRLYGQAALVDADEFRDAVKRGDDLDALCSGILSQWRFYSHWNNAGLSDGMHEWFVAALTHLADLAGEEAAIGRSSSKNGIEVKEFDVVKLVDGRVAVIVDLAKPGVAYLAEIPVIDEESDELYDDFFVAHDEIAEVLPSNHPMPNPYVHKEWWLELMMDKYRETFGEQFPRRLCWGMNTASVVAAIEECLNAGRPYGSDTEPECKY